MRVAALAEGLKHSSLEPGSPDREIADITNDSRRVAAGSLYAALPGLHVDGHRFIGDAIASGAAAILCERLPHAPQPDVAWFVAADARMALSELSDRFFRHPSRDLDVIGVTGTDGKTSTVYYIHQLLLAIAGSSSFLSTAAMQIGQTEQANALHQSTPEAPEVHRTLRTMADHGSRYAVLESTSHGLSHRTCRLAHVHYRVGVFTNLSHEHLEFHGTFEAYRSDKANLFRSLEGGFGVVNRDDENAGYFAEAAAGEVIGYGIERHAEYGARDVDLDSTGSRFTLVTPSGTAPCSLPIPGLFNVSNALAAAAAVQRLTGCENDRLAAAIAALRSVRGRMTVVQREPFSVVVDYAHTPGSFENVLPFFRQQCAGRLIVVFGSAGDRDVAKRP
ncbi:MAG: Mur ligase family protein, partial [Spirochaetota bacterium]